MSSIKNRKKDHVQLTITDQTQYSKSTGFERYYFNHNALPELDLDEISLESQLLNRKFSMPVMISSMTGGYADAGPVNAVIAEFCENNNIPFGVGSQRAMLESSDEIESFSIVRKKAPSAFICANIGGQQLVADFTQDKLNALVDSIEANAIIVHLNPLQELMQPEGDRSFKGILDGIEQLVHSANLPVIVKETGAGISSYVARKLINVGVKVIDVAGAGGTSWSKVENQRKSNPHPNYEFDEWGIPTTECIKQIGEMRWENDFDLIASGGIRTASDIAKSLCLGATFTATAQPIIKAVIESEYEGLTAYFAHLEDSLKKILLLLGCKTTTELNKSHLLPV